MSTTTVGPLVHTFHRVALASPVLGETLFDVDSRFARPETRQVVAPADGKHVFIAGLGRAGSRQLAHLIRSHGEFCSLTYRDMPFVMAPNLWASVSRVLAVFAGRDWMRRLESAVADPGNPAALDEVFWRVHSGRQYIHPDHLARIDVPDKTVAAFRRYVGNVLVRYQRNRYLSRNNNHILRLAALREAFPQALLLVPFRQPLQQASGLLRQHRRWQIRHRVDPLARGAMHWLVRHELGSDHRPFFAPEPVSPDASNGIDYWLRQWIRVYGEIARQVELQNLLPVASERLCRDPERFGSALGRLSGQRPSAATPRLALSLPDERPFDNASPVLLEVAQNLYARLDAMSVSMMTGDRLNEHPHMHRATCHTGR